MPRPKGSKNKAKFMPRPFNRLEDDEQLAFDNPDLVLGDIYQAEKILEQYEVINTTMEIKHVLRTIHAGNISDVESQLNVLFTEGWKLFVTHYLGVVPEIMGGHMVLYIFIREVSAS